MIPEATHDLAAARLSVPAAELKGLSDGDSICLGQFHLTAVPSAHEDIERDGKGNCRCLGYVVQFGPWTVYHSGDTILYEGMLERLRRFPIDVAQLPINGRSPERGVAGNLSAAEAAWLGHQIGARVAIPCHYGMFSFNSARPEDFLVAAARQQQPSNVLR